jgi:hypothetical protein
MVMVKKKKLILEQAKNVKSESGSLAPLIFNLGTFTTRPLPHLKVPPVSM